MDRAAPNIKADEAWLAEEQRALRARFFCEAHISSTISGRCLLGVDAGVSGAIAVALALRVGGALAAFRDELKAMLLGSVQVVRSAAVWRYFWHRWKLHIRRRIQMPIVTC